MAKTSGLWEHDRVAIPAGDRIFGYLMPVTTAYSAACPERVMRQPSSKTITQWMKTRNLADIHISAVLLSELI